LVNEGRKRKRRGRERGVREKRKKRTKKRQPIAEGAANR